MTRPDSPCRAVCTTLYTEYCRGCGRHFMEVANWVSMTEEERAEVWRAIEAGERDAFIALQYRSER